MFSQWRSARGGKREANEDPSSLGADRVPEKQQDLSQCDDDTLAVRLASGEADALTILFERHSALVFRIARRMLRNDGEAEETVQQVFLDAYRAISRFDPEKGSFKIWLLQYAYTRTKNRRQQLLSRGFYVWKEIDDELALTAGFDYRLQLSSIEVGCLVKEMLENLKPQQRRVIEMTFYDGLTAEEIAEKIGETACAVRHNLYRGMAKLRNALIEKRKAGTKTVDQAHDKKGIFVGYERSREF